MEIQLIIEKPIAPQIKIIKIPTSKLLDGSLKINLGKAEPVKTENAGTETKKRSRNEDSETRGRNSPIVSVWDQLAIISIEPPEPEEIIPEETEDKTESEIAANAEKTNSEKPNTEKPNTEKPNAEKLNSGKPNTEKQELQKNEAPVIHNVPKSNDADIEETLTNRNEPEYEEIDAPLIAYVLEGLLAGNVEN